MQKTSTKIFIGIFIVAAAAGLAGIFFAQEAQAPQEDISRGNLDEKTTLIRVDSPRPGAAVRSPLLIEGAARGTWFFEASFPVKVLDADGTVIAQGPAQAQDEWMTEEFVPFSAYLEFDEQPAGSTGTIILEKDNPSGLPEHADEAHYDITFAAPLAEPMTVRIHLLDAQALQSDCSLTTATERVVERTQAPARAAINELLKGLTQLERNRGLTSSIGQGVEIQSLAIADGVARIDFNAALDENVAGSCRVSAIRAQITETLKEFATVDEVVISIDGREDDILQP